MKKTNNRCPKCGEKISPFYMKQTCPHCGVNLMYYRLDERLEEDAKNAAHEVEKVERFAAVLKESTVKTPWHIVRLVLFFTPLASMCLPMYRAGHKSVSLIGFIMSLVNHGFDMSVWSKDYLFAVLAMVGVIVFSLLVIIGSLFSETKKGCRRNLIFSGINTAVLGVLSALVCYFGGAVQIGFYITLLIYLAEAALHLKTAAVQTKKRHLAAGGIALLIIGAMVACPVLTKPAVRIAAPAPQKQGTVRVVTFNTAAPWGTPFDSTKSAQRCGLFADYMVKCAPDFIGTQELNSAWLEKLSELEDYDSYAVKRGGDNSEATAEMNGIFWKKDKYTVLENNTFWLSQTPEKESRFTYTDEDGEQQEAGCHRICTYAVFLNKETSELLAFMNTHLDHASEEARNYGAELILKKIGEIKAQYGDLHIILTGDFNQTEDSAAYQTLTAVLNDTTDKTKAKATWQDWGYTNTGDKPIDFIFTDGEAVNYEVLDDLSEGYISDHYGVLAEIDW